MKGGERDEFELADETIAHYDVPELAGFRQEEG